MQDTKVKTKALDKSNCSTARLGGKEAGVKATSSRTETGYEAGDADELVPHNEVHEVSALQVKSGVVPRKFTPFPGETCPPGGRPRERFDSTGASNGVGRWAGVSRGRSNTGYEPGVSVCLKRRTLKGPDGLTHVRRTKLIGTAETAVAFRLDGESGQSGNERRRKTAVIKANYGDRLVITRSQRTPLAQASAKSETKR